MSEVYGPGELAPIPDDLSIVQFMHDHHHSTRPVPKDFAPWFIEEETGRQIGYEDVKTRTNALAQALHARWGIGELQICIFSPNHVDYPIVTWAAFRLGAIISAANPAYTADELVYQLSATHAKLLVVHPWNLAAGRAAAQAVGLPAARIVLLERVPHAGLVTLAELVAAGAAVPRTFVERALRPGEGRTKLAFLSFSSGTTGLPKAVQIPHFSLIANVVQIASFAKTDPHPPKEHRYRPGDVSMAVLPFYHIYGQVINMHFMPFYGYSVVIIPKFDFLGMLNSIQRYRINFLPVVPPMIVALCKHPAVQKYDLSSVRHIASGAAPLSSELTLQLAKVLPNASVGQGYGMTETCTAISFPQIDMHICTPGSAGVLLPGVVVRVVREDGALAPVGETGELVVYSPSNAVGYLNNDEATRETFRDGWVHTGDEVYVNEKKELFVVDRIKDLIKVKGFQVAPPELEGHILELPDVSDVCVVGVADEYSGEVPRAFVVPSAGAQERIKGSADEAQRIKDTIIKHIADHKVHYKRLAGGVEFIDAVPKNPSGKILRRILRDRTRAAQAASASKAKL
ncbi:amp dependent CoA ligase [Wolfiporia cocos MD-104 SS10]|uniref:Amp dependent CoA ligase n=1 Tax=Wolfiporia cocos (strain MD-104) TaxID=742152 RepID=A0A2H3JDI7_WOLCO|nr:amp dependent CoA ligase [Wolfiporia cocos MD-104 SS10]